MQKAVTSITNSGLRLTVLLVAMLTGSHAFAQCSEYMGRATINEISTIHNWKLNYGDYIEAVLLDSSIPTSVTDEWSLMICSNTCNWAHLSTFTKSGSYFTRDNDFVWGFINWNGSFDVMLRDKWGYTIDYVTVNSHSAQHPSCSLKYDSTAWSSTSTRRTRRLPDSTGDWDTPPGNSQPSTEGESNTTPPAGAATLSIDDVTVSQGTDAVFTINLPGNSYSVTINYSTFDGSATGGTDYTITTGSLVIPAGTTTGTITVPTLTSGATQEQVFYLLLDSVTNANVPDHVAIGTIEAAGAAIDHYRLEYDGSALTCESETVTIKACTDANCSALYASPAAVTFTVATDEPSSSNVNVNFTGSTTITVSESAVTTVTMSLSGQSPTGALKCYKNNVLDGTCSYQTSDTGFIFYNQSAANTTIPTQIAAKPSNVAPNAANIVLKAVQTNTTTGACEALFANNQTVAVELAYQCQEPSSCTNNALQISNNGNNFTLATNGAYSSHNLLFASGSAAEIVLNYPDAGKIQLSAQKTIELGGDIPAQQSKTLSGNTAPFIVRPFGFYVNLATNPGASDVSGGVFKKAGELFDVTVSAVQWQSGDDSDNNGVPDSHGALADNALTPNFGRESNPEQVILTHTLLSPAAGNVGVLSNNIFSGFSNGQSSRTGNNGMSWNEVGIISLSATSDSDYLNTGSNLVVQNAIGNVGRFVPSHFRLNVPTFTPGCGAFSYIDQPFNLAFTLSALGVGDIALSNYDSGNSNDFHGLAFIALVAENDDDGNDLGARIDIAGLNGDGRWQNGVMNVNETPKFTRSGIDGPFDNLFLGVKLDDGDNGVALSLLSSGGSGTDMNASTTGACTLGGSCDAMALHSSSTIFRLGRLGAQEVFGPANSRLSLPLYAQYFDGSRFVINTLDNCSTLLSSEVALTGSAASPFAASYDVKSLQSGIVVGSTTVVTSLQTTSTQMSAVSGLFDLTLSAPVFVIGDDGYVPVDIDLSSYPWLQFDWDTNGTGSLENYLPTKNVTFGQYRGNDRVIYWREKR